MADLVKVLIAERNGVELEYKEEYELVPSNIPVDQDTVQAIDLEAALREANNRLVINQTAHGFTLPTSGVLPVVYDNPSGDFVLAQADAGVNAADTVITEIIDADNFIVDSNNLIQVTGHGLNVGEWYVLDPNNPGQIVPKDTLVAEENLQYVCFPLTANNIQLRLEPMILIDDGFFTDIEEDIAWTEGDTFDLSASTGTNRLLMLWIATEDVGIEAVPTTVTLGGQTGTIETVTNLEDGFSNTLAFVYWTDAQIQLMGNTPSLSVTYAPFAPSQDSFAWAVYRNIDQVAPVRDIQTVTSTAGTVNLSLTALNENKDLVIPSFVAGAGVTETLTPVSFVLGTTFNEFSHDAAVWDQIATAPGLSAQLSFGGNNRTVFKLISIAGD